MQTALAGLQEERVVERTRDGDHTVWGPEPEEVANRLGWLKSPQVMREKRSGIHELVGMGGSSLAPEVYRNIFGAV